MFSIRLFVTFSETVDDKCFVNSSVMMRIFESCWSILSFIYPTTCLTVSDSMTVLWFKFSNASFIFYSNRLIFTSSWMSLSSFNLFFCSNASNLNFTISLILRSSAIPSLCMEFKMTGFDTMLPVLLPPSDIWFLSVLSYFFTYDYITLILWIIISSKMRCLWSRFI